MYAVSTARFSARTAVAALAVALSLFAAVASGQSADGCRVECYPNTKLIHGKGGIGSSKSDNCRWILRTDGKPARLCDHIKCKKVCPNNQAASAASAQQQDQQEAASSTSGNLHIEQQTEPDLPLASSMGAGSESMGIMRKMHGNKLAKAPVPGVAGGRLASPPQPHSQQPIAPNGRRMAPTLPPSVSYDENDTPPPIARFLDISPEE